MKALYLFCLLLFISSALHAQTFQWAKVMNTNTSVGKQLVCGTSGSIYTSGNLNGPVFDMDLGPAVYNLSPGIGNNNAYLAKYNTQGDFVWAKLIYSQNYNNQISDIKLDAQDNIYMIGKFSGTIDFDLGPNTFFMTNNNQNNYEQLFIEKLDSNGNFLWAKKIGDTVGVTLNPSLGITPNGDMLIFDAFSGTLDFDPGIGTHYMTASVTNSYLLKLDALGNFIWAKQFVGNLNSGTRVVMDAQENAYLVGFFQDSIDADPNAGTYNLVGWSSNNNLYVIKLNNNGNFLWARSVVSYSPMSSLIVSDLKLDNQNNVIFVGSFADSVNFNSIGNPDVHASQGATDAFVTKLDAIGNYVWTKSFGGQLTDNCRQLVIDNAGALYLMGTYTDEVDFDPSPLGLYNLSTLTSGGFSYISSLDALGHFIHALSFGTPGNTGGIGINSLSKDYLNHVVVTGKYYGTHDFNPGASIYNLTSPPGGVNYMFIGKYQLCGTNTNQTFASCDSIALYGTTYYYSSDFVQLFSAANGCDSNIIVHLNINHSTGDTVYQTACSSVTYNNVTYTSSGSYMQTYTNSIGCDSLLHINVTLQNTGNIAITQQADTLNVFPIGFTYQWIDCTTNLPVPGAIGATFIPLVSGSYKAVVYFSVDCFDTTTCKNIAVGIPEVAFSRPSISPNPSMGHFELYHADVPPIALALYDLLGRKLPVVFVSNKQLTTFDIRNYPDGIYFLAINHHNIHQFYKLVKGK